jgi:hypothetical protein
LALVPCDTADDQRPEEPDHGTGEEDEERKGNPGRPLDQHFCGRRTDANSPDGDRGRVLPRVELVRIDADFDREDLPF